MENELIAVENNELLATKDGIKFIKKMQKAKIELARMEEELKEQFKTKMEENGIKKFVSSDGTFKVTYYPETSTNRLDSKKLKEELPDVYEQYTIGSTRKAYVKFN